MYFWLSLSGVKVRASSSSDIVESGWFLLQALILSTRLPRLKLFCGSNPLTEITESSELYHERFSGRSSLPRRHLEMIGSSEIQFNDPMLQISGMFSIQRSCKGIQRVVDYAIIDSSPRFTIKLVICVGRIR